MKNYRKLIEEWFEFAARKIYRNRYKTIIILLVIITAIVSQLPKLKLDFSTEGFLRNTDKALIDYNAFLDQFGKDQLIIIAISSQDIFNHKFLTKLKSLHDDLAKNVPYIEDITSLINARNTRGVRDRLIVEDLLEKWPETDEEIAVIKQRTLENPMYKNLLISEDGKITTIVIKPQVYSSQVSEADLLEGFEDDLKEDNVDSEELSENNFLTDKENSKAVNAVRAITTKYEASDFNVYITGQAAILHFIKMAMMEDIRWFLSLAFFTVALFLFIMFRKISGILLPLVIVLLSLVSTIGLMAAFEVKFKFPTQILPTFMLAVSVGYSVHILAIFYSHFRRNGNKEDAVAYSLGHSALAIIMTAATTAGGLFSFSTSDVAPIGDLGIFAGIGVLLAMVYTIAILPALLAITPVKAYNDKKDITKKTITDRLLARVGKIATENPVTILIVSALIIAISIFGITKIRFSHDVLRWLPQDNSVRIATEKINKEMRGAINMEVILDTETENGLYNPSLLNRLEETSIKMENLKVGKIFVGKVTSVNTILKETNRALHENKRKFYTIPQDKKLIAQELLLFENSGSDDLEDFVDSQLSKSRMSMKVPFEDAIAYSDFIGIVNEYFQKNFNDVKVTITGMTAIFFRTITNAIHSMSRGYIYAIIIITILMVLLIGRVRIGLISMIPNLAPIIVILGIMGLFNIQMSLFTMLIGNIALGLAVDDTIHFMHNFRRYFEETNDAKKAVMETLYSTGRAMLITSCVLSIGFFIFMFASMNHLFHFGLLASLTIIFALLADFFIAPALMVLVNKGKRTNEVKA
ncbi:MAG: efflux RND transporter permease subunit [Spirochaetota bacterium]|nr:efflux RND transporter permease subunit [Spirochaetota bacterium]